MFRILGVAAKKGKPGRKLLAPVLKQFCFLGENMPVHAASSVC
jgi:hypothetical protein